MLVSWSLRYWTKAECCGEPVSLVGPIVLLTNVTCDHISSALGKSPFWNGSAALAGSTRRSASADSEAPEAPMNARREIAIVSSHALLLSTAPNDPLSWATLSPSDQIVVRRSQPHRRLWKERRWRIIVNASDATTRIGQLLTFLVAALRSVFAVHRANPSVSG